MKKLLIVLFISTFLLSVAYAQESWNNIEYNIPDQFHKVSDTTDKLYLEDNKKNSLTLKEYDKQEYLDITGSYNQISDNSYQLNTKQINETRYTKNDEFLYAYIFQQENKTYTLYYKTTDETIYVTNTFNPAHTLINSIKP